MINTPPRSNLGPLAQPWGDWISEQTQQNAIAIGRLGGDTTNDGRINNSTLDGLANQINEINQRQSGIAIAAEIVTPSFSDFNVRTFTATIQIPAPTDGSTRIGWLSAQFIARNSNTNQTEIFGSFSVNGKIFHRDSRSTPTQNLEPASWNGDKAITGYTSFTAGPGGTQVVMQLETQNQFSSGARFVTFTDIQAIYQYGQKV